LCLCLGLFLAFAESCFDLLGFFGPRFEGALDVAQLGSVPAGKLGNRGSGDGSLGRGNVGRLFGQDQLNVAGRGHVGSNTTVGAVGPAALSGSLVHLDVLDVKLGRIKLLSLEDMYKKGRFSLLIKR